MIKMKVSLQEDSTKKPPAGCDEHVRKMAMSHRGQGSPGRLKGLRDQWMSMSRMAFSVCILFSA
jgi:hypothetical protein